VRSYDVHQHLWPEALVAALARREAPPRLRGRTLELAGEPAQEVSLAAHEPAARLALLDRDGIDAAVVSLPPTLETEGHPDLVEAYHEGILEIARGSGGRLVPLACGECLDGFAGACVSAATLVAGVEPLLDRLEPAGQILFVHPGPPGAAPAGAPSWWPALVDYTAQMQAAYAAWLARDAGRHPALPVVFAMLAGGGPFQLERLRSRGVETRTALHRNVFFEPSSYGRRALELCLATFGVGQLLYGSDTPVIDSRPTLAALREFGDAVVQIVLRETPGRLVGAVG
jgi:hypothetical protein